MPRFRFVAEDIAVRTGMHRPHRHLLASLPLRDRRRSLVAVAALLGTGLGGGLRLFGLAVPADAVWAATTMVMLVPLGWSVVRSLLLRDVGVDAIALIAMATALALHEYLPGAVIGLMLAGGNALEEFAAGRARRDLSALLERAPRIAHRRVGERIEEVPVEEIRVGELIVVRAGEVVPTDGIVLAEEVVVDESTLTGEPLPVAFRRGEEIRSGVTNAANAFDLRAVRLAADSAYSAIVRLVRDAETQQAPFVRLADRYAAVFLPLSLAIAGIAWAISSNPVRFLAVMVVATPCPLILAAPIAFIAGISRASARGIIVKGSRAVEQLGRARTVLLDKTGTLTVGVPEIDRIVPLDGYAADELLRLAASADQLSAHVVAEALVHEAERRQLRLVTPLEVLERPGQGLEGVVDQHRVAIGSRRWLNERGYRDDELEHASAVDGSDSGRASVLVGIDGKVAGRIELADHVREDAAGLVGRLRRAGVRHVALVTGDREPVGRAVGLQVGVDRVYADCTPETKLEVVRALRQRAALRPVVMVGDGVNDAPALALADVGIAMASGGTTVSSQTADVVIVPNSVDRVGDAVEIGRRSLRIAQESVLTGMALSIAAMGLAAFGLIAPLPGALLQEAIDVAVIANALRALRA